MRKAQADVLQPRTHPLSEKQAAPAPNPQQWATGLDSGAVFHLWVTLRFLNECPSFTAPVKSSESPRGFLESFFPYCLLYNL